VAPPSNPHCLPAVYLHTTLDRLMRPVRYLPTNTVQLIGSLEQVGPARTPCVLRQVPGSASFGVGVWWIRSWMAMRSAASDDSCQLVAELLARLCRAPADLPRGSLPASRHHAAHDPHGTEPRTHTIARRQPNALLRLQPKSPQHVPVPGTCLFPPRHPPPLWHCNNCCGVMQHAVSKRVG